MGTERRTFYGPDIDISSLANALAGSFSRQGYQMQVMPVPNSGLMVQSRKEDTIAGMSSALTGRTHPRGEYVWVEMGGAKWADKGVAAVCSVPFFRIGTWQQAHLRINAWQFIEQYVRTNSVLVGSPRRFTRFGMPRREALEKAGISCDG